MKKRSSVLIVEPRHNMRTFLEMTLSQDGMHVFSAISLQSALLQLRILQPNLIIVGFDAHEAGEWAAVSQINALSVAPVLTVGGIHHASPGPGIADTLAYPIDVSQLCAKVARLLDAPPAPRPTEAPSTSHHGGELL